MFSDRIPSTDPGLEVSQWFDAAPEALGIVDDGRFVASNAVARALVGIDPVGIAIETLLPDWTPDAEPTEAVLRRVGADPLPVEVRCSNLGGRWIVAIRDARELQAGREATQQLIEAETRYRSLVEQVPAVVYADQGDITTYVSPQIESILGVTPEAYIADPGMWLRMVHPDDRPRVKDQSDAFLAGHGADLDDYRMVRPDGRIVWIRDRAFAYRDGDGRVLLEQGLLFDVTELKEAEERVAHMAYHDQLTGLANRQLFEESLHLATGRARRDGTWIGVLYLDLDNFKDLNDTLGHHAGDRLLMELARRLRASTREEDLVARHGGDEFLVLLADLEPGSADDIIELVLDRMREAMARPVHLEGATYVASGSIGISRFPGDAEDVESLLRSADAAMYRAKRSGPNGAAFASGT